MFCSDVVHTCVSTIAIFCQKVISGVSMTPLHVFLVIFLCLLRCCSSISPDTMLMVTPENEASLTLAADLYRLSQEATEALDKERLLRESIQAYPEIAAAYNNLAMLVYKPESEDEALHLLERGLEAAEATNDLVNVANIHNNLGFVIRERGKWSVAHSLEALEHFDKALAINPEFVGALYNKGSALLALRRDFEAMDLFLKVLELNPNDRQAHLDLGRIYFEHGKLEKALGHQDLAIQMATTTKEKLQGMHNKGLFLKEYNFLSRALQVYEEMLTVDTMEVYVLVDLMNAKRSFCDWRDMATLENKVLAGAQQQFLFDIPKEPAVFLPYDSTLLKISDNFRKHLAIRASNDYNQIKTLELLPLVWSEREPTWERPETPNLKIGYLSFDFRDHPMGHLTLGLIEQHAVLARSVNTICYSYGPNSLASAPWRRQFEEKCGVFRDLLGMSDLQAAQTIGLDGIDVLVDLMAHTKGARLGISSLRPSRIVVNYLGYPGTMGSSFTDFAMVDRMVVPPEVAASSMTEQVVYLPHTYQANRYEPSIPSCAADTECIRTSRSQHGLPVNTFVFCNFNTINKMESESFAVWMNILRQVPDSVLWLLAPSGPDASRVMELLHDQAMSQGVLPSRVIFAPRVKKYVHLARITAADLFLDSFIYNAHSTAADALWSNVPIVTFWGDTFPSRVAASLIRNALPFPELVPHSVKDYEYMAVYLSKTPKVLNRLRASLASHTLTSPLFNTKQTTETIEAAYEAMHDAVNRLHPFTKGGRTMKFQLVIQPEHSVHSFSDTESMVFRVNEALQQGVLLQDQGEYLAAENVYQRILRANPGNADATHLLGTIHYQNGKFLQAVDYISQAVSVNPLVSYFHSNLAQGYMALKMFELAETEFHAALELNSSNHVAMRKLRELYSSQKQFDQVVNLYDKYGVPAFSSPDDMENTYEDYSEALAKSGRSIEAILLLERAVEEHPTLFQLGYNLGVLYNEEERYDEGNELQYATVYAQGRYVYETQGQHFVKVPRPAHKVVIAFYCFEYGQAWWGQWGPSSLETGLGGSEEAIVFRSRELQQLGYWVEIYGDPPPQDISNPDQKDQDVVRWYPHYTYNVEDKGVDIFVAWRYHISLALGKSARKKYLWMHDLPHQDAKQSPELLNVDGIFCLSEFHASKFPENLQSKITVSTNAVDTFFFVNGPNHADRFVYGSSPSRGLYTLLKAWPRIRERLPKAELSVFYGFIPAFVKCGNAQHGTFTEWMAEMNRLLTETPGVRYIGLVNHEQLAKEYSYAGFYLYPTTFSESSCISLMKAMVNGAIPITSRFPASALPETTDDFDLGPEALQQNSIGDDSEWLERWIQSIVDAVHNTQETTTIRHRMKRFARKKYRWEHIALQWHRVISKPRAP